MPKPTIPLGHPGFMVRFWAKVDKINGPIHPTLGRCWVWTGGRFRFGYGKVCSEKKKLQAHRLAWQESTGAISAGMCVLHGCDNPPCVNPAHLFLGTKADNNADRDAKGRQVALRGDMHGLRLHPERAARGERHGSSTHPESIARGIRHGSHTHPESRRVGELNGSAKLTAAHVRFIRSASGSHAQVAREYGVSETTVARIRSGRIWKHL